MGCLVAAPVAYVLGSLDAPEIVLYLSMIPILVPAIVYAMGGPEAFRRPPGHDQAARRRRSTGGA